MKNAATNALRIVTVPKWNDLETTDTYNVVTEAGQIVATIEETPDQIFLTGPKSPEALAFIAQLQKKNRTSMGVGVKCISPDCSGNEANLSCTHQASAKNRKLAVPAPPSPAKAPVNGTPRLVLVTGKSEFERVARSKKATKLAKLLVDSQITAADVTRMTDEHWDMVAKAAGTKIPSAETRKLVARMMP